MLNLSKIQQTKTIVISDLYLCIRKRSLQEITPNSKQDFKIITIYAMQNTAHAVIELKQEKINI